VHSPESPQPPHPDGPNQLTARRGVYAPYVARSPGTHPHLRRPLAAQGVVFLSPFYLHQPPVPAVAVFPFSCRPTALPGSAPTTTRREFSCRGGYRTFAHYVTQCGIPRRHWPAKMHFCGPDQFAWFSREAAWTTRHLSGRFRLDSPTGTRFEDRAGPGWLSHQWDLGDTGRPVHAATNQIDFRR